MSMRTPVRARPGGRQPEQALGAGPRHNVAGDRRAIETAELLAGARWQRLVVLGRLGADGAGVASSEAEEMLRQLDEEIAGLQAALNERPWTEAI